MHARGKGLSRGGIGNPQVVDPISPLMLSDRSLPGVLNTSCISIVGKQEPLHRVLIEASYVRKNLLARSFPGPQRDQPMHSRTGFLQFAHHADASVASFKKQQQGFPS